MAAITTAANGNWSATGTWTGGVVPGNGDTVVLNHNVTVDTAVTVGHSPGNADATKAISWGTVNKLLTVNAALTIRGDVSLKANTTKTTLILVQGAGAGIEMDSSAAATPSTTKYQILTQDAASGYSLIRFAGTSTDRVFFRSNAGGGNGYLTRGGFAAGGWLRAIYTDFTRIGDSAQAFYDFYLGNNSGAEIDLESCTFDGCGLLTSATAVVTGGTLRLVNNTWKNTAASKCVVLPPFTNTGTKVIDDNVFDKQVDIGQGQWNVTDNLFLDGYLATAGSKWGSSSGNYVLRSSASVLFVYGDCTNEFWDKAGSLSNAQHMKAGVTSSLTIDGCIFATENANGVGDAIQAPTPSGARTLTVRRNILLPDETSGVQPGKLQGAGGNANATVVCEHNTYISTNAGETGCGYGETYNGHDGILSVKSCVAWSPTSGLASIAIRDAGSVQQSDATTWDYNAVWNPRSGTDGPGYNSQSAGTIFSGSPPGAHDVAISANPFVDSSRNLPAWDASLGGPGTRAHALAELAKRNDPTGYNSAYSIADLVTWIKAGFAVTDASLNNAGHDGVTIGAGVYVSSGVTGTATSELGGLASAATGSPIIDAAATSEVGGLASQATGIVPSVGTAESTLGGLASAATGALGGAVSGSATSELGGLASAAVGTQTVGGTASSTTGGLASQGAGIVPSVGQATSELGGIASAATGTLGGAVAGTASSSTGGLASAATGTQTIGGTASSALSGVASLASGVVPVVAQVVSSTGGLASASTGTANGAPYAGMIRLRTARGPALTFLAGPGPALRFTPREPST